MAGSAGTAGAARNVRHRCVCSSDATPEALALVGAVLLALGVLPILSGAGRTALIAAGALVLLVTAIGAFRDETRPEPPVPPGSGSGSY